MNNKFKKTKVCFILYTAYPLFNNDNTSVFGGAEVDLYNLAIKLAENPQYEVSFIVGDFGQADVEIYKNVRVIRQKYEGIKKYNLFRVFKLINKLKTLIFTNADIYFTETASDTLGLLVLIEKYIKRKTVVFRLASDVNVDLNHYKKEGRKFYNLYKFGLFHSDQIISQTGKQRELLLKNHNINSTVIKNCFFIGDEINLSNKNYILWVSRCVQLKRPELFVELAKKLPFENFIIIMPSFKSDSPEFQSSLQLKQVIIKELSCLSNIKLIEYVPFTEINRYYEGAKLFVNTSLYEGFPNAFIQACMAKTPILSFCVNPDNFITGNQLGYVCNDNLEEALKFIEGFDADKIQFCGENAFKYVKVNHDINTIIQSYENLFTELMD